MSREPTPDWLEAYELEERELDRAYAALSQGSRARLKKTIAQLFAFYCEYTVQERSNETQWSEGLTSIECMRPVPWALAALAPEIESPAQVLAAILPPLSLGVDLCFVVRTSRDFPWPPALVCALELAGIERIYSLPAKDLPPLWEHLQRSSCAGVVLNLGESPSPGPGSHGLRSVSLSPPRCLGLWRDETTCWDAEAILFAHPRVKLSCNRRDPSGPISGVDGPGEWIAFLNQDLDGIYVPLGLIRSALERQPLVLGPGQEGCWVWPQLTRDVFLERRLAWYERAGGI